jgi:ABC-2 type transport system ATP-binding protein
MIAGYLTPDAGSITVNGIDVVKDPIAAKKQIGYLAEANPLYYDMYVKEYLSFIGKVHVIEGVSNAVTNSIELTGLGNESHKKIGQLSKGYKQRIGLAAALIHNPSVLLLDEPTSGLDPNQIIEIRNVIREQGQVKTVLFSSHILQEVEAICASALILSKGQIVANDLLSNLLSNKSQSLEYVFRSLTSGAETPINA